MVALVSCETKLSTRKCLYCGKQLHINPAKNNIKEKNEWLACWDGCGHEFVVCDETGELIHYEDADYWVREDGTVVYFKYGLFDEDEDE